MKDMSFISQVINTHPNIFKYEKNVSAEEEWLNKSLEVKKSKDTDLVTFTLLAHNPERAKRKAYALVDTLRSKHDHLYESNKQMIRSRIENINKEIEQIDQENSEFRIRLRSSKYLNSYNAVIDSLLVGRQSESRRELINKKIELEMGLDPAVTFNTHLLGDVYVTKKPVSPNILLISVITFFLSFFSTVFTFYVRVSMLEKTF
jgi:capsular polysaccharide biosynthesis protein